MGDEDVSDTVFFKRQQQFESARLSCERGSAPGTFYQAVDGTQAPL